MIRNLDNRNCLSWGLSRYDGLIRSIDAVPPITS